MFRTNVLGSKSMAKVSSRTVLAMAIMAILLTEVGGVANNFDTARAQPAANPPQQAIASSVAGWLGYLSNESVSGLTGLYTTQATLIWGGTVGIFGGGVFSGQGNIRLLYSALFENTTLLTAIATPVNTTSTGNSVNATFGLELSVQRGSGGTFRFDINVEQEWTNQNGAWKIQEETWINNDYTFNAVTSTTTQTLGLGPEWVVTPYPVPPGPPSSVDYESCVTDSYFLYCVGGGFVGAAVYYAQLGLHGGAGPWKSTTSYPVSIQSEACVTFPVRVGQDATILCVGGDSGGSPTNQSYAAQLSPDGGIIGPWQAQPAYPIPITGESCVVDSGTDGFTAVQLICVGGDTTGGIPTSAVYYYPVAGQTGIGSWSSTTSYPAPIDSHSCVMSQLYVYCVSGLLNHNFTDAVYFAEAASGGGINGSWRETASYPIEATNMNCVTNGGYNDYVFCVGGLIPGGGATGDVFYARLSHTGGGIIGSWMRATSYNGGFDYNSCVEAISTIWCDWAGAIAYDEILGPDALTLTQTVTLAAATATVTRTTTVTSASATTTSSRNDQGSLLPDVYGLFGIVVIFAVSTVFFAARRKR
jgi:hypothetical protein